jgi:hypothetical protein
MDIRIFNNSTEITNSLIDYYGGSSVVALTTSDYLYVGSFFPFNSLYVKIESANENVANLTVEHWKTNDWEEMVEITDGTSVNGKTLAQSGKIGFVPDKINGNWQSEDTEDMDAPLSSKKIYDRYWLRIGVTANLSATTELDFVGQMFIESDLDLEGEHPILGRSLIRSAYKSGKTDWEEQRFRATELVIDDMISRNLILSGNQLLDTSKLKSATIARCAQLIYSAFGDDYKDQAEDAGKQYKARVMGGNFYIDYKLNATIDTSTLVAKTKQLYR